MKKRRNVLLISIMVIALLVLLIGNDYILHHMGQSDAAQSVSLIGRASDRLSADAPTANVAGHTLRLWRRNDIYYAFLPAACKDNAELVYDLPQEIDGCPVVSMYSESLPAVFIDTSSGTSQLLNSDKNHREPATITVLDENGESSLHRPLEYIKGRGNASYSEFEKKPYQIKFTDAVSLLGMEEGKTWVLLANSADPSLLRNAIARDLAHHLGLAQSDPGVFIDLYLNGEYVGNYYVTEKVEVKENRLAITDLEAATEDVNTHKDLSSYGAVWTEKTKARDIPNDPKDITGGYLIERDFASRFLKEVGDNGSYFITDAEECFILQSPSDASANQVAYIDDYVQHAENAILAQDGVDPATGRYYTELIDADSFTRKYLLEEVTANYDGGVASSFFYKDSDTIDGKLYAGPVWDYDVSLGNTPFYLGDLSDRPNTLTKLDAHSDASPWFRALYEKPDFYARVTDCYKAEISSYLTQLAEQTLPALAEITAASAKMDRVRWQDQYLKNDGGRSPEESLAFLSDYIIARKDFLDQVWIEERPLCQVRLYIDEALYDVFTVFEGEPLPELPTPTLSYAAFCGWETEDGSAPDPAARLYEDIDFYAVLK